MAIDFDDRYNIFTDASTTAVTETSICEATAPAFFVIKGKDTEHPISVKTDFLDYATSPYAELYAILMGVQAAVKIASKERGAKFNLFSDNIMGVNTIRYFNIQKNNREIELAVEHNNRDRYEYNMLKRRIIKTIRDHRLKIDFYHQRGHLSAGTDMCISQCVDMFPIHNEFKTVDYDLAEILCRCNGYVDRKSRDELGEYVKWGDLIPSAYHKCIFAPCEEEGDECGEKISNDEI